MLTLLHWTMKKGKKRKVFKKQKIRRKELKERLEKRKAEMGEARYSFLKGNEIDGMVVSGLPNLCLHEFYMYCIAEC